MMTEAQNEAHEQIHKLMVEHFDAAVCIISCEGHNGEQSTDSMKVTHSGGYATAIGLCEIAKNQLLYTQENERS